ncbi:MAG TPA: branched-chain amino acid ABC transporter permease [Actinomycetota bacterium]|nr:branched-chain amino acid ABC transporter permease [Actinomycetota bacterium]
MPGRFLVGRALRSGAVAGVVLIYLAMVGMLERFAGLDLVGTVLPLSRLLVVLVPLGGGYVAVRPRIHAGAVQRPTAGRAVATGAGAGAIAGVVAVAWMALVRSIGLEGLRDIFVSVTEEALAVLALGLGPAPGGALLVAVGAAAGAIGGLARHLPRAVVRPAALALATGLLFALLQRIVPTVLFELGLDPSWMYDRVHGGLTYLGAAVVVGVSGAAWWQGGARRGGIERRIREAPPEARRAMGLVGFAALLLVLWVTPQLIGSVLSEIMGTVGVFLLMALGLNIVVGYAGLLDLGYVAFFATGAYTLGLLTGANLVTAFGLVPPALVAHLDFWAAVPLVMLVAAVVGLLIGAPVLRLRGDYLAIVTLGFGEIVRILVTSNWLKPLVGGAQGLRDVTDAAIFGVGFRDPQRFFYLVAAFCVLAVLVSRRLANSRVGRAWNAMREDEQVAEAMGISTTNYKLLAFATGGALGCLSGALFAVKLGTIQPGSFEIPVSITALAIVILGGMGSIPGVVVGALILMGLPGLLAEFEDYRFLMYGAVLIAIMILRPQGLVPNVRRMRELQEEERLQDAWLRAKEERGEAVAAAREEGP